jgi:U4/U6.U5 tri-snRNP-associated protein 1
MKTEKKLKKMEEEVKVQQMLSSETSLGTMSALSERAKAAQSAHVILSVGNRGVLPSDIAIAEAAVLSAKKKKTKEAKVSGSSAQAPASTIVVDATAAMPIGNREKVAFGLGGLKRKVDTAGEGEFEESLAKKPHVE